MHKPKNLLKDNHSNKSRDDASSKGTSSHGPGRKFESMALLHLAIKENDISAIKDYMHSKEWVELQTADKRGRTPLHWAVACGSNEVTRLIVKSTPKSMINAHDKNLRTALHYAAMAGKNDIVKILFIKGIKINAKDRQGMTALHYAAQNSNPFLVRSLLVRGADRRMQDHDNQLPYNVAVSWKGPPEIIHLLDPASPIDHLTRSLPLPKSDPYKYSYHDHYSEIGRPLKSKTKKSPGVLKPPKLPMPFLSATPLEPITPRRQQTVTPREQSMEAAVKLDMEKEVRKVESMVIQQLNVGISDRYKQPTETKEEAQKHQLALIALLMRQNRRKHEEMMKEKRERHRLEVLDSQRYKTGSKTTPDFGPYGKSRLSTLVTTTNESSKGGLLSLYNYWNNVGKSIDGLQETLRKKDLALPNSRKRFGSRDGQQGLHQRENPHGLYGVKDPTRQENNVVRHTYPFCRDPVRIATPSRLALTEFVGTSDRKNHVSADRDAGLRIHQCVDKQTLKNQWL